MRDAQPNTKYLKDYTAPAYWIDHTELTVELFDDYTDVTAQLRIRRNDELDAAGSLTLDGQELELLSVALDGNTLSAEQYQVGDESLTLSGLGDQHLLTIRNRIYPQNNTALEGLYRSGGMYCTQCEAEGFRRISYYLDRPDVMSEFTTHIIAADGQWPVMLSNGNKIADSVMEDGRRRVSWHDPFPKPCYLFALVAGDLRVLEDTFTTMSGREVALQIFVEPQNIDKTEYAMDALKRSMRWDEEVYGREYDLDVFMIVAVDDFNMGAMENKGLNIFNSSCVLANPATATDSTYLRIEAIVAHEYFHNWSGNRVTCRDWFQLSLKEGFTVFRDAGFSADMNSATVKRVEDVQMLRTVQFAEDGGPMAHPVQPDSFIEISNFYTVTIYEKGAEVVGMLHRLLGEEGFRKGSDLYFDRHDGQAVTIHEFVAAMEDANGIDLSQFKLWYKQAGTPVVEAASSYDADAQTLTLTLRQHTPDTPGQTDKQPLWIPLALGLLDAAGNDMPVQVEPAEAWTASSQVLHLREAEQTFVFHNVSERPELSLLRHFSAPVKLEYQQSPEQLLFLLQHDTDGFNRWDAGQKLMLHWIEQARSGSFSLSDAEQTALVSLLQDDQLDKSMLSYLLNLPSESYVAEFSAPVDPAAIHHARETVRLAIANTLLPHLAERYQQLQSPVAYQPEPQQMAQRALKNLVLSYWALVSSDGVTAAQAQFEQADNMTDQMAALLSLVNYGSDEQADAALASFYQQWQHDTLVVNQWLSVQAGSSRRATVASIEQLLQHEAFDWRNPNKVRSVLGVFANQALVSFHQSDASGYALLADAIIKLNGINPQMASRLLTPLTRWKRLIPELSALMRAQLERIQSQEDLSKDVYEVVSKSLS
ncbi:aminopeptidase N [Bacterioplanes sanyensis]|uniref:Aminopeptidase N n=1 Tax=Bacterioplanes sanyensis TaxID=1249553 RepID=A0A222FNZ6_9GAMM|nr:aminopeptidase N [Bacterioplanes sanyensis]ASP40499.1 aminopeptidase N [Bacterioplanes sanyensis]